MIKKMSNVINDPDESSVKNDFSCNFSRRKKITSKLLTFKCKNYFDSFLNKHALVNHQSMHYKISYSCSKCSKVLYSHQSITNHLSVHKNGVHTCRQCDKTFLLKSTLKNHLCVYNNNTDVCQTCTKTFQSRTEFLKHAEKCSKDSNVDEVLIE